jgi:hypothetical protein
LELTLLFENGSLNVLSKANLFFLELLTKNVQNMLLFRLLNFLGQNSEKLLKSKEELCNCSLGAAKSKDFIKKTVVLRNNL